VLAANLLLSTPLLGPAARRAGHVGADESSAELLLRVGEVVLAFPEGSRGMGKPYADRYQAQPFGGDGYVGAAIRTGTPIIPCAITGSEEIYPKLGDLAPVARLLGLPYFPVTPLFPQLGLLGMVPLPAKWHIEFGAPIDTTGYRSPGRGGAGRAGPGPYPGRAAATSRGLRARLKAPSGAPGARLLPGCVVGVAVTNNGRGLLLRLAGRQSDHQVHPAELSDTL
jgi:hypothetical protein